MEGEKKVGDCKKKNRGSCERGQLRPSSQVNQSNSKSASICRVKVAEVG